MRLLAIVSFVVFFLLGLLYLVVPNPDFPDPLPDSMQSSELGDTEELGIRRAYFTDYTREEVVNHYREEFGAPLLRLNYPPEEAQQIIRDQTRSTYLEELVHPFRESVYINGFEPKEEKDEIRIDGVHFEQKIIVKYVQSSIFARIFVYIMTVFLGFLLIREWHKSIISNE